MAPDFFESDHQTSDADISSQPETMTDEPQAAAPRRARRSLFQIVCLQRKAKAEPPSAV
jgi:hypothetical protein